MSGNEDSSDDRLDRQDYPYFTDDEFKNFSVEGKDFVEKMHISCQQRYETRIAKFSLNHDKGRNLEMDLNIVICGKTGSGMSSTANTILGRKAFTANRSSNSVTKVSLVNTCTYRNRRITVVDTPGIYSTDVDEATIKKELARIAFLLKDGVHCFIMCMSAGDTRFTEEVNEVLKLIKQDRRGNVHDYCMLTCTKAEAELETCTLDEFLEQKKENGHNRRLLENIKDRVVAVNNNCLVPAEALRNRDALIEMVDAVVARNIQNKNSEIWTDDLFEAAGSLRRKLSAVVQDNNFQPAMVNATIEVIIRNTHSQLPYDAFLKEVISILKKSEEFIQNSDFMISAEYGNQIHQIYDKIQPEVGTFRTILVRATIAAAAAVTAAAVTKAAGVGAPAAAAAAAGTALGIILYVV